MVFNFYRIYFALLMISFLSCISKVTTIETKKPNVLLFYMDDLRPEISSFRVTQIQSPNTDAFAERGVQFTNAYCNVPVCGASRESMLIGLLPTNAGRSYESLLHKFSRNIMAFGEGDGCLKLLKT